MKSLIKSLLRFRIISFPYRLLIVWRYFGLSLKKGLRWSLQRTEYSNFYYDLTEKNKYELAHFVAFLTDITPDIATGYINEILDNKDLKTHIQKKFEQDKFSKDSSFHLGRRIGWYAFVRALKPRLVIETGVHQGIGAVTIISALKANRSEGFPGKYLGTDIDNEAGELVTGDFLDYGKVLFGDSIESLRGINQQVDLFINDSDHSSMYEYREYIEIAPHLDANAFILSDNSHATDSLLKFSQQFHRQFLLFREEPLDHWYPGAGIGVSIPSHKLPKMPK